MLTMHTSLPIPTPDGGLTAGCQFVGGPRCGSIYVNKSSTSEWVDVGVYMDTVDNGQLVSAHLASKPEDRVKTPCAENYPTVLGDRADDDETLWEAHKLRQVERERALRQTESGTTRAGECDEEPETPKTPAAAAPSASPRRSASATCVRSCTASAAGSSSRWAVAAASMADAICATCKGV